MFSFNYKIVANENLQLHPSFLKTRKVSQIKSSGPNLGHPDIIKKRGKTAKIATQSWSFCPLDANYRHQMY